MNLFYIRCSIFYLSVILFLIAFYLLIVIVFMFLFLCKALRDEVKNIKCHFLELARCNGC